MNYINFHKEYLLSILFLIICIIMLLPGCKKNDDDLCTCYPVFKTKDTIIILNEYTDKVKIELVICDYNVEFYYTLNGQDPDKNSTLYNPDSGIVLGIGNYLIKVKGYLNDAESDIVEKRYIITILPLNLRILRIIQIIMPRYCLS
jgi:hypothetical protein